MQDSRIELTIKLREYELEIIKYEKEFRQKHIEWDQSKFERFLCRKMKADTEKLLELNISPVLKLKNR